MHLKDSQTYRNAKGEEVTVTFTNSNRKFPFEDSEGRRYTHEGKYVMFASDLSKFNLVKEI